jgi:hypothetical protein
VSGIVGSTNHMAYVQDRGNVNKHFYGSVTGITEAPISHDNVHDSVMVINRFLCFRVEHAESTIRMIMCMTT